MNPIVLSFADGTMFFVGMIVVVAGLAFGLRARSRLRLSISAGIMLFGAGLALLTATPFPIWVYIVWLTLLLITLLRSAFLDRIRRFAAIRRAAVIFLALLSVSLIAVELPHHRAPRISVDAGRSIYVLGDSITSGVGEGELAWPAVMAMASGQHVVNLARAGATVESALLQARGIVDSHGTVLIEIGGNDLLGSTDDQTFKRQLDALLTSLRGRGIQTIAMFELPLPPFRNTFGRVQRELAAKHRIVLIPKRFIAAVLGMPGATLDGLHLSQTGHDAMAAKIASLLQPAVEEPH